MKMMIVDDSAVIRRKIERETLLDEITEVIQAGNGIEAVELCKRYRPELVTMDLTMPEMDGVECVKHLIQIKPDIMVLVISALSDKTTAIQAIKNGARGFVCKPFTDAELNAALARMVADAKRAVAV